MARKAAPHPVSENELLEHMLVAGAEKFGKPKREDKLIYGRLHGRDDLLAFAQYIDPEFQAAKHIKLIADKLTLVEQGKLTRLIINMPPRHGKSQLVSKIFPVWAMGRNPKRQLVYTSYNASKAQEFTRWQRDWCENPITREVFPKLFVRDDVRAAEEWQTTAGGIVYGAGVGGTLTGRGGDILVIDDPYKDYEEANSEVIQEKIWNWYLSTFRTRLSPKGAIIVVHTRWTTNDLTARLVELEGRKEDGGLWDVVRLPAIDNEGQALWPERFPITELHELQRILGKLFEALYQQEPIDLVGLLFDNPQYTDTQPDTLEKIGYYDPAFGGADDNALAIGGNHRIDDDPKSDKIYLTNGYLWRGLLDKSYDFVEKKYHEHKLKKLWVEDNAAQKAVVYELKKRGLNVEGDTAVINKFVRIQSNLKVHWLRILFSRAVEQAFMKQILSFSEDSKKDHAPDASSGLVSKLTVGRTSLSKRYSAVGNLFKFRGWR